MPRLEGGDPRERWIRRAFHYAEQLGLPTDFIVETKNIIEAAFSKEWLDGVLAKKLPRTSVLPPTVHPIEHMFHVSGESRVVELMELAVYLKHLTSCRNLPEVVTVMKNSYSTGLLQLAYAYRFKRCGCKCVELEPETSRGKADIYFEYDSRPYVVECYTPKTDRICDSSQNLYRGFSKIFAACRQKGRQLRVCIRLKTTITAREARRIGHWIAKAIEESDSACPRAFENDLAACEVDVVHGSPTDIGFPKMGDPFRLYRDADWGVNEFSVSRKDLEKVSLGEEVSREEGSCIFVWQAESEKASVSEDQYVEGLIKRLGKKLRQTKARGRQVGRIVIAAGGFLGSELDEPSRRVAKKIQSALVPRYPDTAMIMLVQRRWSTEHRYRYTGHVIPGYRANTISVLLYKSLCAYEETADVPSEYR